MAGVDKILSTGIRGMIFKNWAETYLCTPEFYFAPKTVTELQQILAVAHEEHKKVRVVGCGHSPSDLPCTSGFLVSLQNINKILEVDQNKSRFKAEAGITVDDLNSSLLGYGMSLSVLGAVSGVTLAGVISTNTHGTGIKFGSMSTYVIELDIMTYNGEIISCSRTKNQEIFLAALCSIGCLGVILNVTYQCEKAFNLEKREFPLLLSEVLEQLNVHINASEHFRFVWVPHTEGVVVNHINRTTKPVTQFSRWTRICNWFWVYGLEYHAREFLYWMGSFFPSMVPHVNRFFYNFLGCTSKTTVNVSYKVFNIECFYKQYVSEWAVDISQTALVLWQLKNWLDANPTVRVHYAVEVRFVKADDIYISPSYGRDSCYINIINYRPYKKDLPHQVYWQAFENIMIKAGGRPHWSKTHPVTANEFSKMYPHWKNWCRIRMQLDPTEMFTNVYTDRVFDS